MNKPQKTESVKYIVQCLVFAVLALSFRADSINQIHCGIRARKKNAKNMRILFTLSKSAPSVCPVARRNATNQPTKPMKFLTYSNRLEINTPIVFQEKQHLAKINGKWASVFSFVKNGRRKFKCRQIFATDEQAGIYWLSVSK